MREGDMDKGNPSMHIDPSIEESYADIGRAVVEAAMGKSSGGLNKQGEVDIDVKLRLKVQQSEAQGMRPVVCCICTIDAEGVVTCKGSCCQYD
jgi:hypothetical protein